MAHDIAYKCAKHWTVYSCRRLALVPTKVRALLLTALHASMLSVVSLIWAVKASMKYMSASGVRV